MRIIELEAIRDTYLGVMADLILGKRDKAIQQKIEASLVKLNEHIESMPAEKEEKHYVTIYLAYEFYRLKTEYFDENAL